MFQKTREARTTKEVAKWDEWAQAGRPSPFRAPFSAPFDLDDPRTIYSPLPRATH
jgi:hypothetical protein